MYKYFNQLFVIVLHTHTFINSWWNHRLCTWQSYAFQKASIILLRLFKKRRWHIHCHHENQQRKRNFDGIETGCCQPSTCKIPLQKLGGQSITNIRTYPRYTAWLIENQQHPSEQCSLFFLPQNRKRQAKAGNFWQYFWGKFFNSNRKYGPLCHGKMSI